MAKHPSRPIASASASPLSGRPRCNPESASSIREEPACCCVAHDLFESSGGRRQRQSFRRRIFPHWSPHDVFERRMRPAPEPRCERQQRGDAYCIVAPIPVYSVNTARGYPRLSVNRGDWMLRTKGSCCRAVPTSVRGVAAIVVALTSLSCVCAAQTCTPVVAKVVSIQGNVELRRSSAGRSQESGWQIAELNVALCAGDAVRTHERSRAALLLNNETTLRLDQRTTLTLGAPDQDKASLLGLLRERSTSITRTSRPFQDQDPVRQCECRRNRIPCGRRCGKRHDRRL